MSTSNTNDIDEKYCIEDKAPELLRGPVWLKEKRAKSSISFNEAPLPRRGLHLWRYTDPNEFLIDRDKAVDTSYGENYERVEKLELAHLAEGNLAGLVTDLGGRDITVHGNEALAKKGVIVSKLSDAMDSHPEMVKQNLYSLVNSDSGKFEALNGALFNDGIFIYVPDGVTLEKPLHLLREAGLSNSTQYPRLLVVVGKNAEITIIDEYGGGAMDIADGTSNSNSVVEIIGGQDSRTRYVQLQRFASGNSAYLSHRAKLGRGATILTIPLAFGSSLSKSNFGIILDGEGSDSNIFGLLFGAGRQHFDNHTLHHHTANNTTSNIDFKVVLRDRALSAYTGLIRIEKTARTCEAYQTNRNLLLNPGTKAEAIPELEILNEDVSCSHGATVGPIDPLQVFYLKCRGIGQAEAVRMIVSGFVETTLKQVPDDLRERITEFVSTRLEDI